MKSALRCGPFTSLAAVKAAKKQKLSIAVERQFNHTHRPSSFISLVNKTAPLLCSGCLHEESLWAKPPTIQSRNAGIVRAAAHSEQQQQQQHSLSSSSSNSSPSSTASIPQTTTTTTTTTTLSTTKTTSKTSGYPDFDVPLAVTLAGASFEAYADVSVKGLVQKCPGDVEIVYTNREFLQTKLAGLLKVSLCHVTSIQDENNNGSSTSVLVCKFSSGESCLEIHKNEINEAKKENEEKKESGGYLFVQDIERSRFSIRVEWEGGGSKVGGAFVPMSELCGRDENKKGKEEGRTLELRDVDLHVVGSVQLKIQFLPFSDVFLADQVSGSEISEDNLLGSPGPALMTESWQNLSKKVLHASHTAFDPVAYLQNASTSTQLWLFVNKREKQLVLAFRGTVQDSWRDLLTDLNMVSVNLKTELMAESPRHAQLGELSSEPGTLSKVMGTVAQAKKEVDLRKEDAKKVVAAAAATINESKSESEEEVVAKKEEEGKKIEAAAEGLVSTAVEAVKNTAGDLQEFLTRLKEIIDAERREEGAAAAAAAAAARPDEAWVHAGFLSAYDSVRGSVLWLVDAALAEEEEENNNNNNNDGDGAHTHTSKPWTILLCGHSLGGALATLCAFDLSKRIHHSDNTTNNNSNNKKKKNVDIAMYNFGSPRVGNKAFATEFNKAVPNAWRLVNRNDGVATIPRLMGYCHIGHAVVVGEGGVEVLRDTSEAPYEGLGVHEVLPAVSAAFGAAVSTAVSSAVPEVVKGAGMEIAGAVTAAAASAVVALKQNEPESSAEKSGVDGEPAAESVDGMEIENVDESEGKIMTAEQLSELWESEKEAWTALLVGKAISEHMEDYYFKGLEEAVDEWRERSVGEVETDNDGKKEERKD